MFKKIKSHLIIIELLLIFLSLSGWFAWKKIRSPYLSYDFAIDAVALVGLLTMIIFRSNSPRHYWYGFGFLVITSVFTLFGIDTLANITAGVSLTFFSYGVVNQLVFRK